MITINAESYFDCIEEIKPLLYEMHVEVEGLAEEIPLDPDYARYEFMDENGLLRIHIVREQTMGMIGFMVSMVGPHAHHKDVVYSMADLFYVMPEYREGSTVAPDLIKFAQKDLKDNMDVKVMVIGMKIKHEFRRLLQYCGFGPTEELWEKVL